MSDPSESFQSTLDLYRSMNQKRMPVPPLRPGLVREPLPPLTLSDIPPSPGLRNRDPNKGKRVRTYYLGFIMSFEDLSQWGADHDLDPAGDPSSLSDQAWETLFLGVPYPTMAGIVRYGADRSYYGTAFAVATNVTPEDMARSKDLEYIECVRTILGTREPPIWYRPERAW